MENNITQLTQQYKNKKYFSIDMAQAELLFDEYSKGNADALQVLKTGLVPFALRLAEMQTSVDLYSLTRVERYAAALDLLDKLIVPYISTNREGFNKYYARRIGSYLQTALRTRQFSKCNNSTNVTLNSTDVSAKDEAIKWLKSDILQSGSPSLAAIDILTNSVLPNLQSDARNILKNILQFVNIPQVWSYVTGINPAEFTAAAEIAQDKALQVLESQSSYQTAIANIKGINKKAVSAASVKQTSLTQRSLEERKKKFGEPLKDVNIEALKKALIEPKLIYVLDEYMLCKNNLSAKQINTELGLSPGALVQFATNILSYATEGGLDSGKPYRTATSNKSEHIRAFKALVDNPEQFRATLTDDDQIYVLDNYFLANTKIKDILEHLNIYRHTLDNIIEDILVNAGATPTKTKRKANAKIERGNTRLDTRIQKYADLLKNIDVEALKTALNNQDYAYIIDEYMLNKNGVAVKDIKEHLGYTQNQFTSAVDSIELRIAKINNSSYVTPVGEQIEAQKASPLTTIEAATIYAELIKKQVKQSTKAPKDFADTRIGKREEKYKALLKNIDVEALKAALNNSDYSYIIDEYMLNKNGVAVKDIKEHLGYTQNQFTSAVDSIELRIAKINNSSYVTPVGEQIEAQKASPLTTQQLAEIYSQLVKKVSKGCTPPPYER